jgi:tetratricopeptide (TPR) repeat protein
MMEQDLGLLRLGLADGDRLVRLAAARRLSAIGYAEGKAELHQLVAQGDLAGLTAFGILRKLGEPVREPPELLQGLTSSNPGERAAVLEVIAELPPTMALQLLQVASNDAQVPLRLRAAELAHELALKTGQPEFARLLSGMHNDTNVAVRLAATELAARLRDQPAPVTVPLPRSTTAPSALVDGGTPPVDQQSPDAWPALDRAASAAERPAPVPPTDPAVAVQQLLDEARAALKKKQYSKVQSLLDRGQRLAPKAASKGLLLSELLYLQGELYDRRGQWREAMDAYTRYQRLPAAQQRPESARAVGNAVARLKTRMGLIQIFTSQDGRCRLTEEYYLPAGEHLIGVGGGQSRMVTIDVGAITPVRQCQ